jgi:hypothetical protein
MQKTLVEYVYFKLTTYMLSMCTFDLWMNKGAHNVLFGVLNNGFALFSTNNSIVKSYSISKDLGNMWS